MQSRETKNAVGVLASSPQLEHSDYWGIMGIPLFPKFACPMGRQIWEKNEEEFAFPPVANATGGYSPKALRALYNALSANFAYTMNRN